MRGRLLLSACGLAAFLTLPACAENQPKKKRPGNPSSPGRLGGLSGLNGGAGGVDVGQLQGLMARAKAAQSGQGELGAGDARMALKLAEQLGLSPEDLAAMIQKSQAGQNRFKGVSRAQLAARIRALSKKHGAPSTAKKKGARALHAHPAKVAHAKAAHNKAVQAKAAYKKAAHKKATRKKAGRK
jgi:hypothetical protein